MRDQGEELRARVVEKARRRLAQGADSDEVIEYATASLMKKLLHNPTVCLCGRRGKLRMKSSSQPRVPCSTSIKTNGQPA